MMSCTSSASMFNTFKMPRMSSSSYVIEHGLIAGILLVLVNAAIKLETLEIMTGVVGVLAVCVMKESAPTRRNCGSQPLGNKGCKSVEDGAPCLSKAEPPTQLSVTDETPTHDAELVQLRACVQAELVVLRAECKLEVWKNKAEVAEAELSGLHDKVAELEKDLSQAQSNQLWTEEETPRTQIEALLMELTEAKLKVEEVEADLAQAQTSITELENDVAQATLMQREAEDIAQARIEAWSAHLTSANDDMAAGVTNVMWKADGFSAPVPGVLC